MRGDRPRRLGIKQRRAAKRAKRDAAERARESERSKRMKGRVPVNPGLLRSWGYSIPDVVERGFYVDRPFVCKDCGKAETWNATQQKWWYESAKGGVWTVATRCRPCRRRERERKAEARRVQLQGLTKRVVS